MRQIFTGAFLLLTVVSAFAQHVLTGKVMDENNRALVGATVVIQNAGQQQKTSRDGTFRFEQLKGEHYVVETSFVGYETSVDQATTNKELIVKLQPKAYSIEEVTISSLRATNRSAVSYSNVNAEEISKRNLGQDIPYLLALTPSFVTTSDAGTGIGYTGFRVRGTDANRINMTVNGVPLNDSESHGVFFVNMPDFASSLSSVQIQRGVGTSTNGAAAFGASVNMQTELLNAKPYAETSSTYGSFNTLKYNIKAGTGLLENKLAFDARISGVNSDGYVDRAFVKMKSYYMSAGYYGDKTTLKFITYGGKEKTYQAWNGVDLDMVAQDPLKYSRTYNELGKYTNDKGETEFYNNQTDNYTQIHYQLHWIQELKPKFNLNVALHYTDGNGYYEEYKEARKYIEYGLTPAIVNGAALKKTDLIRQKKMDNDFYGMTFAFNYNTSEINATFGGGINRYDGTHIGKILWVRQPNDFDPKKDWYRNTGIKDDANIYAKINAEITENLSASIDLQYRKINYKLAGISDKFDKNKGTLYDITQKHEFDFFNPKFGLTYKMDNQNEVYASFSIANREPNRNNYTDAGLDELPKSEKLKDTELGYRFQSSNFSASINCYYMKYKDQLVLTGKVSEIGEALTSNIPDSYRAGIELTAGLKLSDRLRWDGNVTVSKNKVKNFTETVESYDANWNELPSAKINLGTTDIAYSPSIIANSIFTFNMNNFEAAISSNYVGKQYIDNTSCNDRAIDAYLVSNLRFGYTLKLNTIKSINFNILINNFFNEEYETNAYNWWTYSVGGVRYNEKRYFPQAGTNFLAGITLKF